MGFSYGGPWVFIKLYIIVNRFQQFSWFLTSVKKIIHVSCSSCQKQIMSPIHIVFRVPFYCFYELHNHLHAVRRGYNLIRQEEIYALYNSWVKVFRIIPQFRILRLTFHRKSASKCWIRELIYIPEFRILRLNFLRKSASKSWIREVLIGSLMYVGFV